MLEAKAQELLEASRDLKSQCTDGLATDGLKVVPIHDLVADLLQPDPADKTPVDGLKRQVMPPPVSMRRPPATTAKLTFNGVCIRGNTKTEASNDILKDLLKARIECSDRRQLRCPNSLSIFATSPIPPARCKNNSRETSRPRGCVCRPPGTTPRGNFTSPASSGATANARSSRTRWAAFAKDPQNAALVKGPVTAHLTTFDAAARVADLQRKWIEYAGAGQEARTCAGTDA